MTPSVELVVMEPTTHPTPAHIAAAGNQLFLAQHDFYRKHILKLAAGRRRRYENFWAAQIKGSE